MIQRAQVEGLARMTLLCDFDQRALDSLSWTLRRGDRPATARTASQVRRGSGMRERKRQRMLAWSVDKRCEDRFVALLTMVDGRVVGPLTVCFKLLFCRKPAGTDSDAADGLVVAAGRIMAPRRSCQLPLQCRSASTLSNTPTSTR